MSGQMSSRGRRYFDVLVVGAGPAGMAAAISAAKCGLRVGTVDDNFHPGGQIWRTGSRGVPVAEAVRWFEAFERSGIDVLFGTRVFDQLERGVLLAETPLGISELGYGKLIIATGARERFLPFPGWTLPNVMGAGAVQAMVKHGLPIKGKRVVVAGSGPLLMAVSTYLLKMGARIPVISEQASWRSLARFAVALSGQRVKIGQALRLKMELARIPFSTSSWPVEAHGKDRVESVSIWRRGRVENIRCDYLACGFHLVPNTELASLIGCRIERGCVQVDDFQQTSITGTFCAGEPTGVGGVELALVEGQIAGLAAGERTAEARLLFRKRKRGMKVVSALEDAFRLREELRRLASSDTLVCRCEDVSFSRLQPYTAWRAAKLQTRCGMGPCQGRVCGPATQFLFNWNTESVRPPIFPVLVESWANLADKPNPEP